MYDSHYHDCHENFNIFVKTILTKRLWSVKPKISLCVRHSENCKFDIALVCFTGWSWGERGRVFWWLRNLWLDKGNNDREDLGICTNANGAIAPFADFYMANISTLFLNLLWKRKCTHQFLIFDAWSSNCRNDFSFQYFRVNRNICN